MANSLPDEIISEILSPALRVSDAAFSSLSTGSSSFMTFSESPSAYLVVSKAWLRVSTPLLYHDVILRSKAQAQALAATLTVNPALGRFIKKLRVEGGYAISMHKILQHSKNITDLFLSMTVASSDNASGLCRGLPLLDPVRVIIDTGDSSTWTMLGKPALKLMEAVEKCIPIWKKMTVLQIPSHFTPRDSQPFVAAPSLETLVVWQEGSLYWVPQCIRIIARNPSLKRVRLEPPKLLKESFNDKLYTEVKQDKRLMALWNWMNESPIPTDDASSPSPFVYPAWLAADPVQEDAIWSRVLYFALERNNSESKDWTRPSRLSPILACKKFARLGVPHLFTRPRIYSSKIGSFGSQLELNPELGGRVRCLTIDHRGEMSELKRVITRTTALTELYGFPCLPITWKAFCEISESTGASLRSFQGIPVIKSGGSVDPKVFALFQQMREFSWDSKTSFKTAPKSVPTDSFNLLVDLTVNTFDVSFLEVLSHMELPSLRTVVFAATAVGSADFFQKHGAKLQKATLSSIQLDDPALAIWRSCPSLTVLGVSCDDKHPPTASCFKNSDISPHLERIVFQVTPCYRFSQGHMKELHNLLLSLKSTASFPALREIEHPCCYWPTKEPAISKSPWVRWAESLHEEDIHLVNPDGVRWRPRLKFVKKSRR